mmetsp:Transcript_20148/g.36013  ORF Transcript_20148/g.36013 Transcript_20148/m.36013 type:complete len:126 (+) Transcript_20148:184-561(+)
MDLKPDEAANLSSLSPAVVLFLALVHAHSGLDHVQIALAFLPYIHAYRTRIGINLLVGGELLDFPQTTAHLSTGHPKRPPHSPSPSTVPTNIIAKHNCQPTATAGPPSTPMENAFQVCKYTPHAV